MAKELTRSFDLQERLINFAVRIIRVAESLPDVRTGNHIRGQLCVVALHQHQIMPRRKVLNLARTLFTK